MTLSQPVPAACRVPCPGDRPDCWGWFDRREPISACWACNLKSQPAYAKNVPPGDSQTSRPLAAAAGAADRAGATPPNANQSPGATALPAPAVPLPRVTGVLFSVYRSQVGTICPLCGRDVWAFGGGPIYRACSIQSDGEGVCRGPVQLRVINATVAAPLGMDEANRAALTELFLALRRVLA